MVDEVTVPVEKRYLIAEGIVSKESLSLLGSGLPKEWSTNAICCFLQFAYADIPIGAEFQYVFPRKAPSEGIRSRCRVTAVTQEFGKPFDAIPKGWKTITLLEFPDGIPDLIRDLPVVDTWYKSDAEVCLSSEDTWTMLV
jgi:hypothetical protein